MKQLRILATAGATLALLLLVSPRAVSWGAPVLGEDDKAEQDGDAEEDEDEFFAIVGGDVYTGTGAVLRGATILSKNGKIEEIGYGIPVPEETETLDATGYCVYPGLVAIAASSRISRGFFGDAEAEAEWEGAAFQADCCVDNLHPDDDPGTASAGHEEADDYGDDVPSQAESNGASALSDFDAAFDPFNAYLVLALSTGITTVQQSNTAAKLKRYEIEGVGMKEKHMNSFSWSPSGRKALRDKLQRAAEYLREYRAWEEIKKKDKEAKEPSKKGVDNSTLEVLQGKVLAKFSVNDREDLLAIARLAQAYGFRPVLEGCREGWTVAEELGRAGAFAIVTSRDRRAKDERLVRPGGTSIENAAILHDHGVQVAIRPANPGIDLGGITGRDLLHLPIEAGFAVRGGLSNEAALAGITIIPARVLGIEHRVGTLEVGKDCDAIVTDGDLLHYQTFVQWTVVEGKLVYDKQEELLFHHIRPRPEIVEPEPEPEEAAEEAEEDPDEDGDDEGQGGDDDGEDG